MKIKFGAAIVDGRGKIGGHVASKNRAGAYLRTKVTPVNRDSDDQRFVRSNQTTNSKAWAGLTAAQRTAWNNATADYKKTDIFGDIKTLTGFQLYCKLNGNLKFIAQAVITTPPAPSSVPSFATMSATCDLSDNKLTLSFTPAIAATEVVVLEATQQMSAGKNFVKSEYRKTEILTDADTTPCEVQTAYAVKFGSPFVVGRKIFLRAHQIVKATGLPGAAMTCSCIVVA